MCIVCLNRINLYLWSKRAVVFDLLAFVGEGSRGKRAVYMVTGKQRGSAPQWEIRGLTGEDVHLRLWAWAVGSSLHCERRNNSQTALVSSSQMKCQGEDCGLLFERPMAIRSRNNTDTGY